MVVMSVIFCRRVKMVSLVNLGRLVQLEARERRGDQAGLA